MVFLALIKKKIKFGETKKYDIYFGPPKYGYGDEYKELIELTIEIDEMRKKIKHLDKKNKCYEEIIQYLENNKTIHSMTSDSIAIVKKLYNELYLNMVEERNKNTIIIKICQEYIDSNLKMKENMEEKIIKKEDNLKVKIKNNKEKNEILRNYLKKKLDNIQTKDGIGVEINSLLNDDEEYFKAKIRCPREEKDYEKILKKIIIMNNLKEEPFKEIDLNEYNIEEDDYLYADDIYKDEMVKLIWLMYKIDPEFFIQYCGISEEERKIEKDTISIAKKLLLLENNDEFGFEIDEDIKLDDCSKAIEETIEIYEEDLNKILNKLYGLGAEKYTEEAYENAPINEKYKELILYEFDIDNIKEKVEYIKDKMMRLEIIKMLNRYKNSDFDEDSKMNILTEIEGDQLNFNEEKIKYDKIDRLMENREQYIKYIMEKEGKEFNIEDFKGDKEEIGNYDVKDSLRNLLEEIKELDYGKYDEDIKELLEDTIEKLILDIENDIIFYEEYYTKISNQEETPAEYLEKKIKNICDKFIKMEENDENIGKYIDTYYANALMRIKREKEELENEERKEMEEICDYIQDKFIEMKASGMKTSSTMEGGIELYTKGYVKLVKGITNLKRLKKDIIEFQKEIEDAYNREIQKLGGKKDNIFAKNIYYRLEDREDEVEKTAEIKENKEKSKKIFNYKRIRKNKNNKDIYEIISKIDYELDKEFDDDVVYYYTKGEIDNTSLAVNFKNELKIAYDKYIEEKDMGAFSDRIIKIKGRMENVKKQKKYTIEEKKKEIDREKQEIILENNLLQIGGKEDRNEKEIDNKRFEFYKKLKIDGEYDVKNIENITELKKLRIRIFNLKKEIERTMHEYLGYREDIEQMEEKKKEMPKKEEEKLEKKKIEDKLEKEREEKEINKDELYKNNLNAKIENNIYINIYRKLNREDFEKQMDYGNGKFDEFKETYQKLLEEYEKDKHFYYIPIKVMGDLKVYSNKYSGELINRYKNTKGVDMDETFKDIKNLMDNDKDIRKIILEKQKTEIENKLINYERMKNCNGDIKEGIKKIKEEIDGDKIETLDRIVEILRDLNYIEMKLNVSEEKRENINILMWETAIKEEKKKKEEPRKEEKYKFNDDFKGYDLNEKLEYLEKIEEDEEIKKLIQKIMQELENHEDYYNKEIQSFRRRRDVLEEILVKGYKNYKNNNLDKKGFIKKIESKLKEYSLEVEGLQSKIKSECMYTQQYIKNYFTKGDTTSTSLYKKYENTFEIEKQEIEKTIREIENIKDVFFLRIKIKEVENIKKHIYEILQLNGKEGRDGKTINEIMGTVDLDEILGEKELYELVEEKMNRVVEEKRNELQEYFDTNKKNEKDIEIFEDQWNEMKEKFVKDYIYYMGNIYIKFDEIEKNSLAHIYLEKYELAIKRYLKTQKTDDIAAYLKTQKIDEMKAYMEKEIGERLERADKIRENLLKVRKIDINEKAKEIDDEINEFEDETTKECYDEDLKKIEKRINSAETHSELLQGYTELKKLKNKISKISKNYAERKEEFKKIIKKVGIKEEKIEKMKTINEYYKKLKKIYERDYEYYKDGRELEEYKNCVEVLKSLYDEEGKEKKSAAREKLEKKLEKKYNEMEEDREEYYTKQKNNLEEKIEDEIDYINRKKLEIPEIYKDLKNLEKIVEKIETYTQTLDMDIDKRIVNIKKQREKKISEIENKEDEEKIKNVRSENIKKYKIEDIEKEEYKKIDKLKENIEKVVKQLSTGRDEIDAKKNICENIQEIINDVDKLFEGNKTWLLQKEEGEKHRKITIYINEISEILENIIKKEDDEALDYEALNNEIKDLKNRISDEKTNIETEFEKVLNTLNYAIEHVGKLPQNKYSQKQEIEEKIGEIQDKKELDKIYDIVNEYNELKIGDELDFENNFLELIDENSDDIKGKEKQIKEIKQKCKKYKKNVKDIEKMIESLEKLLKKIDSNERFLMEKISLDESKNSTTIKILKNDIKKLKTKIEKVDYSDLDEIYEEIGEIINLLDEKIADEYKMLTRDIRIAIGVAKKEKLKNLYYNMINLRNELETEEQNNQINLSDIDQYKKSYNEVLEDFRDQEEENIEKPEEEEEQKEENIEKPEEEEEQKEENIEKPEEEEQKEENIKKSKEKKEGKQKTKTKNKNKNEKKKDNTKVKKFNIKSVEYNEIQEAIKKYNENIMNIDNILKTCKSRVNDITNMAQASITEIIDTLTSGTNLIWWIGEDENSKTRKQYFYEKLNGIINELKKVECDGYQIIPDINRINFEISEQFKQMDKEIEEYTKPFIEKVDEIERNFGKNEDKDLKDKLGLMLRNKENLGADSDKNLDRLNEYILQCNETIKYINEKFIKSEKDKLKEITGIKLYNKEEMGELHKKDSNISQEFKNRRDEIENFNKLINTISENLGDVKAKLGELIKETANNSIYFLEKKENGKSIFDNIEDSLSLLIENISSIKFDEIPKILKQICLEIDNSLNEKNETLEEEKKEFYEFVKNNENIIVTNLLNKITNKQKENENIKEFENKLEEIRKIIIENIKKISSGIEDKKVTLNDIEKIKEECNKIYDYYEKIKATIGNNGKKSEKKVNVKNNGKIEKLKLRDVKTIGNVNYYIENIPKLFYTVEGKILGKNTYIVQIAGILKKLKTDFKKNIIYLYETEQEREKVKSKILSLIEKMNDAIYNIIKKNSEEEEKQIQELNKEFITELNNIYNEWTEIYAGKNEDLPKVIDKYKENFLNSIQDLEKIKDEYENDDNELTIEKMLNTMDNIELIRDKIIKNKYLNFDGENKEKNEKSFSEIFNKFETYRKNKEASIGSIYNTFQKISEDEQTQIQKLNTEFMKELNNIYNKWNEIYAGKNINLPKVIDEYKNNFSNSIRELKYIEDEYENDYNELTIEKMLTTMDKIKSIRDKIIKNKYLNFDGENKQENEKSFSEIFNKFEIYKKNKEASKKGMEKIVDDEINKLQMLIDNNKSMIETNTNKIEKLKNMFVKFFTKVKELEKIFIVDLKDNQGKPITEKLESVSKYLPNINIGQNLEENEKDNNLFDEDYYKEYYKTKTNQIKQKIENKKAEVEENLLKMKNEELEELIEILEKLKEKLSVEEITKIELDSINGYIEEYNKELDEMLQNRNLYHKKNEIIKSMKIKKIEIDKMSKKEIKDKEDELKQIYDIKVNVKNYGRNTEIFDFFKEMINNMKKEIIDNSIYWASEDTTNASSKEKRNKWGTLFIYFGREAASAKYKQTGDKFNGFKGNFKTYYDKMVDKREEEQKLLYEKLKAKISEIENITKTISEGKPKELTELEGLVDRLKKKYEKSDPGNFNELIEDIREFETKVKVVAAMIAYQEKFKNIEYINNDYMKITKEEVEEINKTLEALDASYKKEEKEEKEDKIAKYYDGKDAIIKGFIDQANNIVTNDKQYYFNKKICNIDYNGENIGFIEYMKYFLKKIKDLIEQNSENKIIEVSMKNCQDQIKELKNKKEEYIKENVKEIRDKMTDITENKNNDLKFEDKDIELWTKTYKNVLERLANNPENYGDLIGIVETYNEMVESYNKKIVELYNKKFINKIEIKKEKEIKKEDEKNIEKEKEEKEIKK